jgi:hypothetical protein
MPVTHNQTATKNTHPHSVYCDRPGCEWRTAHRTEEEAVRIEATHPCPHKLLKRSYMTGVVDERGQEYTPPNHGQTVVEKAWDRLDEMFDKLINPDYIEDDQAWLKGWCQALAWTIHTWAPHWYREVDDVTRQAVKRRQMRVGEIPWEPTPGYQYNPMPMSHQEYARVHKQAYTPKDAGTGTEAVKKVAAAKLKPQDIQTIKDGLKNGFTVEDLAHMLQIPENVVKSYV